MDLGLAGRKAIVCASSRGLGKGCALALAEAGCDVIVNGRNRQTVLAAAGEIAQKTSTKPTPVVADVASPEGQEALLAACPEPDILVNNNGGPPFRDFRDLTRAMIVEGVTQNMIVPIELLQRVIDGMAARGFGRIVNITSSSIYMPIAGLDLSSGARAGLVSFLAGVARGVAHRNVTINTLLPGKMDTDRLRASFTAAAQKTGKDVEHVRQEALRDIPARRPGTAEEFGKACAFLCSAHAGYITGQNLLVDGGLVPRSL